MGWRYHVCQLWKALQYYLPIMERRYHVCQSWKGVSMFANQGKAFPCLPIMERRFHISFNHGKALPCLPIMERRYHVCQSWKDVTMSANHGNTLPCLRVESWKGVTMFANHWTVSGLPVDFADFFRSPGVGMWKRIFSVELWQSFYIDSHMFILSLAELPVCIQDMSNDCVSCPMIDVGQ